MADWYGEARKRLEAASDRASPAERPLDSPELSPAEIERRADYVRRAVQRECQALAKAEPGGRQSAIGSAALAVHGLLKGLDGCGGPDLEDWAYEQWREARDALGEGEHTADDPSERWERCRADAEPRDLTGKGGTSVDDEFEAIADVPDLAEWDRRRAGIPDGDLTEGSEDISIDEIVKWRMSALVKGIFHPGEQAVMYADPGAGKSFVALDLAWHVAQGKPWHGRKVARAPVLYVALEGVEGFRGRMKAAELAHGPAPWFRRQKAHVSLIRDKESGGQGLATVLHSAEEAAALCGQPVGFIIVDTLARAMAGDDENSAKDVMHFVDHRAGVIARTTGAAVLTVAHTNKLGGLRGSLTLSGAVNVVLKVEREGDARKLIGEKVKDGDDVPLFDFTLRRVHLATDPDGDPVQSCVIDATPPKPPEAGANDKPTQKALRAAWQTVADQLGRPDVPLADVRVIFEANHVTGKSDPKEDARARGQAWGHAMRVMREIGLPGLKIDNRDGVEIMRIGFRRSNDRRATNADDEFQIITEIDGAATADG